MGRPIARANIQLELPEFDPKNLPEWAEKFAEFRKMSLISALQILMKSCRLLMVKFQNQRSK